MGRNMDTVYALHEPTRSIREATVLDTALACIRSWMSSSIPCAFAPFSIAYCPLPFPGLEDFSLT